jgi:hypothetical protein
MKEEDTAENGVEGRVERASSKGSDGQGDEAGGEETLKCPMVRTVGGVGLGNGSRVVDCECVSVIQKISCEASQAAMRLLSKSFHTSTLNALRSGRENGRSSSGVMESSNALELSSDARHESASGRRDSSSGQSRSHSGLPKQRGTRN